MRQSLGDWDMSSGRNYNYYRKLRQESLGDWDMSSGRNRSRIRGCRNAPLRWHCGSPGFGTSAPRYVDQERDSLGLSAPAPS